MLPASMTVQATGSRRLRRKRFPHWPFSLVFVLMLGTVSAEVPNERCVTCHGQQLITFLPIKFSDGVEVMPYVDVATYFRSAPCEAGLHRVSPRKPPGIQGGVWPAHFPHAARVRARNRKDVLGCHQLIDKTNDGRELAIPRTWVATVHSVLIAIRLTRREVLRRRSPQARQWKGRSPGTRCSPPKAWSICWSSCTRRCLSPVAVLLHRVVHSKTTSPQAEPAMQGQNGSWFQLPEGFSVHRGHAWALPEGNGVFKIGMDDFAGRLIGEPTALMLPSPGGKLDQGERGWQVRVNGDMLDVLSPVRGEVLEINEQVINSPSVVPQDPYGQGWLIKVRARKPKAALANLLSGRLARAWYDDLEDDVRGLMQDRLGTVLQDGGTPVSSGLLEKSPAIDGLISPRKFLLTNSPTESPE